LESLELPRGEEYENSNSAPDAIEHDKLLYCEAKSTYSRSCPRPRKIHRGELQELPDRTDRHIPGRMEAAIGALRAASNGSEGTVSTSLRNAGNGAILVHARVELGSVHVHQTLQLGPCPAGHFYHVLVSSMRSNDVSVRQALAGQCITIVLRPEPENLSRCKLPVERGKLPRCGDALPTNPLNLDSSPSTGLSLLGRKRGQGLVLLSKDAENARGYFEFRAEVLLFNHPNTIGLNYQPVILSGSVRQSARLLSLETKQPETTRNSSTTGCGGINLTLSELGAGESAICRFAFLYRPEFLTVGAKILLREGHTRGVGTILSLG